jgi:uncharacterized protein YggL (DUF469 family)
MAVLDPANTQTFTQVLLTLMPVIVGGVIAIVSGVLGTIFSHLLKTSTDRRERRRAKLEEIVTLTFEVEQWFEKQKDYFWWAKQSAVGISPLDKCRPMIDLYFPELQEPMSKFWTSAVNMNQWIVAGGQEKSNTGAVSQAHIDSYPQVYKPFHHDHMEFITCAAGFIHKLT